MKPNSMDKTFETFIEDSSNRFALAACKSILSNGETFNPLTIYGPSGLGKTHLLMAIKRSAETACPGKKAGYFAVEELVYDYLQKIRDDHTSYYRLGEECLKYDIVLFDGVEELVGKSATQEEFFFLINRLEDHGKTVVMACSIPPKNLSKFYGKLMERFDGCLLCDIAEPSTELCIKYAKRIATELGLKLTDEMIKLASEKHSNLAAIRGEMLALKLQLGEGNNNSEYVCGFTKEGVENYE